MISLVYSFVQHCYESGKIGYKSMKTQENIRENEFPDLADTLY